MKKLAFALLCLIAGCTVNHIVPYAYIVGDAVSVPEDQLSQYWVHSALKPEDLNGPGNMGCVRLGFMIDSRAGIWNPQVEAIYGDKATADWAIGVLNGISFSPAGTNNAKRAVMTELTLSYNHAPEDVKNWDACQAAVGAKAVSAPPAQTAAAPASGSSPFVEACRETGVQCVNDPITVKLFHKDGSPYGMVLPPPSVVIQGDYVNILAGQTVYVEADVQGDKLVNLRLVQSVTHPEKTLVMKLEQFDIDDKSVAGGHMMMFHINNPFGRDLKYHAGIMPLDQSGDENHVYKTSTCPVMAKISGSETWPEPIFQIVVGEFHFPIQGSEEAGCVD